MHEHVLIFITLDSDKEQDGQSNLRNDPANLATLLSLFCRIPTRHDSKHFSMAIRNVSTRMFADEQPSTITMHYRNECIMCNRSKSTILRKDSPWSWVKNHRSLRCIPHSIDLCDACHTKLYRAKPWLITLVQVALIRATKSWSAGTCMF